MWTKFYKAKEGDVTVFVVSAADGQLVPCFEMTSGDVKLARAGTKEYAIYAALTWAEEVYPPVDAGHD